jgi:hypothetical protein
MEGDEAPGTSARAHEQILKRATTPHKLSGLRIVAKKIYSETGREHSIL